MPLYKQVPHPQKKHPTVFEGTASRLVRFLIQKRREVISTAVSVATLGLLFAGFQAFTSRYASRASVLLYQTPWMDSERVLEGFPRSDAAVISRLALGTKALEKEEWDKALEHLTPLLSLPSDQAMLRVAAQQNIGLAWRGRKDLEKALTYLRKAEGDPGNVAPEYTRLLIAEVLWERGEQDEAKKIYDELETGGQWGYLQKTVQGRVDRIKKK